MSKEPESPPSSRFTSAEKPTRSAAGRGGVGGGRERAARVEAAPPPTERGDEKNGADAAGVLDEQVVGSVEAVLLSVDRPVSGASLGEALGLGGAEAGGSATRLVRAAVERLNSEYGATGRSFRIEAVAGGYRLMTLPRYAAVIESFAGRRERTSLSRASVETLAIIAYKQPITRAQLESIRGVACGEVLRTLVERRLVTVTGRAEELGRPMLYGTTRQFLETFGLSALKDLPSAAEFKERHSGGDSGGGEE